MSERVTGVGRGQAVHWPRNLRGAQDTPLEGHDVMQDLHVNIWRGLVVEETESPGTPL